MASSRATAEDHAANIAVGIGSNETSIGPEPALAMGQATAKALSTAKRQRSGYGTFKARDFTRSNCVICFEPMQPNNVATLWGEKPRRIGQPWERPCEHECCCWECAKVMAATLQDREQPSLTAACPECRAPAAYLRRGYVASNRSRIPVEEACVASLRKERALALGSVAATVQAEEAGAMQLLQEQAAADAELAMELHEEEEVQAALDEAHALQQVADAVEREREREHVHNDMEAFGACVIRELRPKRCVWLLACAYAGSVHGGMTELDARAVAEQAMAAQRPVLMWGGVHGRRLYELGRSYGRRRAMGTVDQQLLQLLCRCGLEATVSGMVSGRSNHRATVEMHVTAAFMRLKVSTV